MTRALGMYVDATYYPLLITFANSVKYFNVDARLKLYDYGNLNHLLREHAKTFCNVIPVDSEALTKQLPVDWWYLRGAAFKGLIADLGLHDDIEIQVDVDTVALTNFEHIFKAAEQGKLVATKEFTVQVPPAEVTAVSSEFKRLTGCELKQEFDIYNSGLVGFNKLVHKELITNWARCLKSKTVYEATALENDQNMLSQLMQAMNVPIENLDIEEWMPIHGRHKGVTVGFDEAGKIAAYREGKRLSFYHYTGSIGMRGDVTGRFFHKTQDYLYNVKDRWPKVGDAPHAEIAGYWDEMWEQKWNSSAHLLAKYFHEKGPLTCPKVFNYEFRERVASTINVLKNLNVTPMSKETLALALAYDYITLLGYRWTWQQDDWMALVLQLLTGKNVYAGTKSISWKNFGADVTLTDEVVPDAIEWSYPLKKRTKVEELGGVYIVLQSLG